MRELIVALAVAISACGGPAPAIEGRLIDVVGGIEAIERFVVVTEVGESLEFVPGPGATFDGGPLSHIRDHLISGEPVVVSYEERDGVLIATAIEDA